MTHNQSTELPLEKATMAIDQLNVNNKAQRRNRYEFRSLGILRNADISSEEYFENLKSNLKKYQTKQSVKSRIYKELTTKTVEDLVHLSATLSDLTISDTSLKDITHLLSKRVKTSLKSNYGTERSLSDIFSSLATILYRQILPDDQIWEKSDHNRFTMPTLSVSENSEYITSNLAKNRTKIYGDVNSISFSTIYKTVTEEQAYNELELVMKEYQKEENMWQTKISDYENEFHRIPFEIRMIQQSSEQMIQMLESSFEDQEHHDNEQFNSQMIELENQITEAQKESNSSQAHILEEETRHRRILGELLQRNADWDSKYTHDQTVADQNISKAKMRLVNAQETHEQFLANIQSAWKDVQDSISRIDILRKFWEKAQNEHFQRNNNAAIIIQKYIRGYQTRKQYTDMLRVKRLKDNQINSEAKKKRKKRGENTTADNIGSSKSLTSENTSNIVPSTSQVRGSLKDSQFLGALDARKPSVPASDTKISSSEINSNPTAGSTMETNLPSEDSDILTSGSMLSTKNHIEDTLTMASDNKSILPGSRVKTSSSKTESGTSSFKNRSNLDSDINVKASESERREQESTEVNIETINPSTFPVVTSLVDIDGSRPPLDDSSNKDQHELPLSSSGSSKSIKVRNDLLSPASFFGSASTVESKDKIPFQSNNLSAAVDDEKRHQNSDGLENQKEFVPLEKNQEFPGYALATDNVSDSSEGSSNISNTASSQTTLSSPNPIDGTRISNRIENDIQTDKLDDIGLISNFDESTSTPNSTQGSRIVSENSCSSVDPVNIDLDDPQNVIYDSTENLTPSLMKNNVPAASVISDPLSPQSDGSNDPHNPDVGSSSSIQMTIQPSGPSGSSIPDGLPQCNFENDSLVHSQVDSNLNDDSSLGFKRTRSHSRRSRRKKQNKTGGTGTISSDQSTNISQDNPIHSNDDIQSGVDYPATVLTKDLSLNTLPNLEQDGGISEPTTSTSAQVLSLSKSQIGDPSCNLGHLNNSNSSDVIFSKSTSSTLETSFPNDLFEKNQILVSGNNASNLNLDTEDIYSPLGAILQHSEISNGKSLSQYTSNTEDESPIQFDFDSQNTIHDASSNHSGQPLIGVENDTSLDNHDLKQPYESERNSSNENIAPLSNFSAISDDSGVENKSFSQSKTVVHDSNTRNSGRGDIETASFQLHLSDVIDTKDSSKFTQTNIELVQVSYSSGYVNPDTPQNSQEGSLSQPDPPGNSPSTDNLEIGSQESNSILETGVKIEIESPKSAHSRETINLSMVVTNSSIGSRSDLDSILLESESEDIHLEIDTAVSVLDGIGIETPTNPIISKDTDTPRNSSHHSGNQGDTIDHFDDDGYETTNLLQEYRRSSAKKNIIRQNLADHISLSEDHTEDNEYDDSLDSTLEYIPASMPYSIPDSSNFTDSIFSEETKSESNTEIDPNSRTYSTSKLSMSSYESESIPSSYSVSSPTSSTLVDLKNSVALVRTDRTRSSKNSRFSLPGQTGQTIGDNLPFIHGQSSDFDSGKSSRKQKASALHHLYVPSQNSKNRQDSSRSRKNRRAKTSNKRTNSGKEIISHKVGVTASHELYHLSKRSHTSHLNREEGYQSHRKGTSGKASTSRHVHSESKHTTHQADESSSHHHSTTTSHHAGRNQETIQNSTGEYIEQFCGDFECERCQRHHNLPIPTKTINAENSLGGFGNKGRKPLKQAKPLTMDELIAMSESGMEYPL